MHCIENPVLARMKVYGNLAGIWSWRFLAVFYLLLETFFVNKIGKFEIALFLHVLETLLSICLSPPKCFSKFKLRKACVNNMHHNRIWRLKICRNSMFQSVSVAKPFKFVDSLSFRTAETWSFKFPCWNLSKT